MKKQIHYVLLLCAILTVLSCNTDESFHNSENPEHSESKSENESQEPERTVIKFNVGKKNGENMTLSDSITLFAHVGGTNEKTYSHTLKLSSSSWQPLLYWDETGDEALFTSYYPGFKTESPDKTFAYSVCINQQHEDSIRKSDIQIASTFAKKGEEVNLIFAPLMSRLTIRLSSNNNSYSKEELGKATITIKQYTSVSINALSGKTEKVLGKINEVTPCYKGDALFQAILPPQQMNGLRKAWISVLVDKKEFTFDAPNQINGKQFNILLPGEEVNITLNLEKEEAPIPHLPENNEWIQKTVWVYGVKEPSEEDWGYVTNSHQRGIKWKEGCGWYDCNKLNMSGGPDSNLCWAATAANMLYWWLEQNEKYIKRYGKYTGPQVYKNSKECPIFDCFKRSFPNIGGITLFGINWFLSGKYKYGKATGGNYFPNLFGEVGEFLLLVNKESFNNRIKKALSEKEAIGFCMRIIGGMHEMSIWGADFDEKGEISAIYTTDSNDLDLEENLTKPAGRKVVPVGLIRHPVNYSNGKVYMEGSVEGRFTIQIQELHFLNLMEKEWERILEKQEQEAGSL